MDTKTTITVSAIVNAAIDKVWKYWTMPEHITNWYFASDDWHAPRAVNDLKPNGNFLIRMEAKDKSFGFDFEGIYDEVKINELITYTIGDGRKIKITFSSNGNSTEVIEIFDAENQNTLDQQKSGWQSILDNFKKYVEKQIID